MLIVFQGMPFTTPLETVFDKQSVAEVFVCDFIGERAPPVGVGCGIGRLDRDRTIAAVSDAGVIQGVDVDGHAPCVCRNLG